MIANEQPNSVCIKLNTWSRSSILLYAVACSAGEYFSFALYFWKKRDLSFFMIRALGLRENWLKEFFFNQHSLILYFLSSSSIKWHVTMNRNYALWDVAFFPLSLSQSLNKCYLFLKKSEITSPTYWDMCCLVDKRPQATRLVLDLWPEEYFLDVRSYSNRTFLWKKISPGKLPPGLAGGLWAG